MPEEVDQNLGKRNAINTPELFQQTLVLIASKVPQVCSPERLSAEDLFKIYVEHLGFHHFDDIFESEANKDAKNHLESLKHRNEGNEFYQKKHNESALFSYTKALQFSVSGSQEMALAYANRSAVLVQQNDTSAALRDIERSLKNGYPKNLEYKLYERKSKCLMAEKRYLDARTALQEAIHAVEYSDLNNEKKNKVLKDINLLQEDIEKKIAIEVKLKSSAEVISNRRTNLPKITSPNKHFPNLSNSVEIIYNEDVGRHGVAANDIQTGELLAVEDTTISYLKPHRKGKNCTNCFEHSSDFVPSPISTQDVFCSERCLEKAMESYHPIESNFPTFLTSPDAIRIEWLLALRSVTMKPVTFFVENQSKFETHKPKYGSNLESSETFKYDSTSYKSIFNLVSLNEKWHKSTNEVRSLVGFLFVVALKRNNYFNQTFGTDDNLSSEEGLIARILLHFMAVASLNCYEVGTYQTEGDLPWHQGKPISIGLTYQPTLALLNHSCDPNTIRFNIGRATLLIASRDIKRGEEISDCYFTTYAETPRDERQLKLDRYLFKCECQACLNNWPTHDGLPKGFEGTNFKVKLESLPDAMSNIQRLGSAISAEQKSENYDRLVQLYIQFQRKIQETLEPPHSFYFMAARHLYKCFWILHGSKIRIASQK